MQSLLQTKLWAQFKARHGWRTHYLTDQTPALSVLGRPLPLGKSLLYAPEATLADCTEDTLRQLVKAVRSLPQEAIFFRLELFEPLGETGEHSAIAALTKAGFRKAFEETQPEHRQWVDITGDEATILANMKEKGRYNIRLSQRKGVTTRVSTDISGIEVFYRLLQETAKRNRFVIRSYDYFADLAKTLFSHNLGELVIASYQEQPLVALLITYYDGLASYLYGASASQYRGLMAPYAAHFATIVQAKKRDCHTYDMLQVAPPEAKVDHYYANLTRFKEQFGGRRVDLVGGWDYVYQPTWYQLFKVVEQVRRG